MAFALRRPVSIRALLLRSDGTDESIDLAGRGGDRLEKDELLWVDLESPTPDELELVRTGLRLDEADAERLERTTERPKAIVLGGAVEVDIVALGEEIEDDPVPLQLLIGDGWVVTRHAATVPFLARHWEMIQDQREVGRLSSVEFLAEVLDWHLEEIFDAAEGLEQEVDGLDEAALRTESDLLERLVRMRRRIARLRRILNPHRVVLAELRRPDFLRDGEGAAEQIDALTERFARVQDAISNVREMLIGSFDVHMTRVAQRTNDVMRILTLASVVLLPSVVVAGVMGMNFKVGLFDNASLFWVVVAVIVAIAPFTLGLARARRWI